MQYRLSDAYLANQFLSNIKKREIWQEFLYMWAWASHYYSYASKRTVETAKEYISFFEKHFSNSKWIDVISLWCWDSGFDKYIFSSLNKTDCLINYVWIDSSKEMLELSKDNIADIPFQKKFLICWDYNSDNFWDEINNLIWNKNPRLYVFLWWSFCNANQTSITDWLYNMLWENDSLWFDLPTRENDSQALKLKIFNRLTWYLNNEKRIKFLLEPLKSIWIFENNWKLILETSEEKSIWSIVFNFYFEFTEKSVVNVRGKKIHFLPNERIRLDSIRNYIWGNLIHFFEEHEFKLIDQVKSEVDMAYYNVNQFLFKRK